MQKYIFRPEFKFFFLVATLIALCISSYLLSLNTNNLITENNRIISLYEEINIYPNEKLDYNQQKRINSTRNTVQSHKKLLKNTDSNAVNNDNFLTSIKINELMEILEMKDKNNFIDLNQKELSKIIDLKILTNNKSVKRNMHLLQFLLLMTLMICIYSTYDLQKNKKIKIIESNLERDHEKNEMLIRANKIIDGHLNESHNENAWYYHEISKKISIISITYGKKIIEIKNIARHIFLNEDAQYKTIKKLNLIIKNDLNNEITPFLIEKLESQISLLEKMQNEKENLKKRLEKILDFFKIHSDI